MNIQLSKIALTLSIVLILFSCGESKKNFIVQGTISNADTLTLYLERRGHSDVSILDSTKLDAEGKFAFKQEALNYSEFYRLRLNNNTINFSIDSTETITVNADSKSFSTRYTVEGSYSSSKIKEAVLYQLDLRNKIAALQEKFGNNYSPQIQQEFSDSILAAVEFYKNEVTNNIILDNNRSTAAYFAIFQQIENTLIYNPTDKMDLQLFRAVATTWDGFYANSPRAEQLKNYTLSAIVSAKNQAAQQANIEKLMEIEITKDEGIFTISLPNVEGKNISTKAFEGKVIVLDFTAYQTEYSLAHNIRLKEVYDKYKSAIEIYQVSFDTDKHTWKNAAVNIPWTSVWDEASLQSPLITKFNLESLPTTYIINKQGDIVKKIAHNEDLAAQVAKAL